MSIGDVIFAESYPPASSLTAQEQFLVAGLSAAEPASGQDNWLSTVFYTLQNYYAHHQAVPGQLSQAVIAESFPDGAPPEGFLEFLKSPLTGAYPRFDQSSFSAGNLYVKVLDNTEIERVARYHGGLKRAWKDHKVIDSASGEWVSGGTASQVFYFRVYGAHDVILTGVKFTTAPD